jgi:serine/threonine protein kinase
MDQVHNLKTNEIVDDKYRLLEKLGEGGSAVVFRAIHTELGTQLAIKLITQTFAEEGGLSRFKTEAQILAQLQHKNIVRIFHCGFTKNSVAYMALEYVDGISLRARLQNSSHLSPEEITDVISQVLDGLSYAHKLGVVHRDLKPENIVLCDGEGQRLVKLLDFGLAKILPNAPVRSQDLTQNGIVVGSPIYMSPEQCIGSVIDARSDIYSLGCILYEMITGHPPFSSDSVNEVFLQHHHAPVPDFPLSRDASDIEKGLAAIAINCLQKEPADRYQSAEEMQSVLADLSKHSLIPKLSARQFGNDSHFNKRTRFYCASIGLGLTALVILLFLLNSSPQAPQALSYSEFLRRKVQLDGLLRDERDKADPQMLLSKLKQWLTDNPPAQVPLSATSVIENQLEQLRLLNYVFSRRLCIRLSRPAEAHDYALRIINQARLLDSAGVAPEAVCNSLLSLEDPDLSAFIEPVLESISKRSIIGDAADTLKENLTLKLAGMYLEPCKVTNSRLAKAKALLAKKPKQVRLEENRILRRRLEFLVAEDPALYLVSSKSITEDTGMKALELAERCRLQGNETKEIELLKAIAQAKVENLSKDDVHHWSAIKEASIIHLSQSMTTTLTNSRSDPRENQGSIDAAITTLQPMHEKLCTVEHASPSCRWCVDNTLALAYQLKGKRGNHIFFDKAKAVIADGQKLLKDQDTDIASLYNNRLAEILLNYKKYDECIAMLRATERLVLKSAPSTIYNRCQYYRELGFQYCDQKNARDAIQCLDYSLQPEKLRIILSQGTPSDRSVFIELAQRISVLEPRNQHITKVVDFLKKTLERDP